MFQDTRIPEIEIFHDALDWLQSSSFQIETYHATPPKIRKAPKMTVVKNQNDRYPK